MDARDPGHSSAPNNLSTANVQLATVAEVLRDVTSGRCQFVELQFTDVSGALKGVVVPSSQIADALTYGHWFDGSSLEGGARTTETDLLLWPDLRTWSLVPWVQPEGMARVLCDIRTPDGDPFPADPRAVLARAIADSGDLGFELFVAPELEFFLFQSMSDGRRLPADRAGYFDLASDTGVRVREEIVRYLNAMNVSVDASHHEIAPGQHEIDLPLMPAALAADAIVAVKYAVKAVARRRGLAPTFMPKPLAGVAGSGLHLHQTLRSSDGADVFWDPIDEYGLSATARAYIAGQLSHARAACAVLAPQVNSYKRLGRGFDAPSVIGWSQRASQAMIRVPRPGLPGRSPDGRGRPIRVELRCADPSCNPYLAIAVALGAGLDGIRQGLSAPEPVGVVEHGMPAGNVDMLPVSLGEALTELAWDGVVRDTLGSQVHDRLLTASEQEWQTYKSQVTEWEFGRAFDAS